MSWVAAMLVALAIDAAIGWPDRLYQMVGHPVTWMGRLIAPLEKLLNRSGFAPIVLRILGFMTTGVVVLISLAIAWGVASVLPEGWLGIASTGVLAWPFVAARSLHDHVSAVAVPLQQDDIAAARSAVSMIVGRNPDALDEAGIARASIESLAENASDGVVAPLFWGALLGLPGIVAYKAINTLDSMIGYRNERYEYFGWFAARLDDLVNIVPARMTGVLFVLVSSRKARAMSVMVRDAGKHRSPNAGWPEAAMASAIGVRLSGPRAYDGRISDEPWVNEGAPDPIGADIVKGLQVFKRSLILFGGLLLLIAYGLA